MTTVGARTLPPWDPSRSDGCSSLGKLIEVRWPAARDCCLAHDCAYYYGGSATARLRADRRLWRCWLRVGVPGVVAGLGYVAVRALGGPRWRRVGVSWAHGGRLFAYTELPAQPPRRLSGRRP